MLGLMALGALAGYLAIAILVTALVVRWARTRNASIAKRWLAGGATALAFYLIPFWDWIPTALAHRYYCATEAKFEEFKTLEQWKRENPEILPTLRYDPRAPIVPVGEYRRFPLNQRLAVDGKYPTTEQPRSIFLSVRRIEGKIVDLANERLLAHYVDFEAGHAAIGVGGEGAWKFWLRTGRCDEAPEGYRARFEQFQQQIQQLGEKAK